MKKSKNVTLNYYETKQDNLKKRQYKITLPVKLVDEVGWKPKDRLHVFVNRKRHLEIRKPKS